MINFTKYFFRIKKINLLLTFLSLLNFGIMFGAEEDKEEHKMENNFDVEGDKKNNGDVNKNNDCSCYKCCLDCCNWVVLKAMNNLPNVPVY